MRRAVDELRRQNVLLCDGLLKIALAEAEARAGDPDRAVPLVDEGLATAERTGYRAFEAELHRVRGEILLKRDPSTPAPAEYAFLTAITVSKQQGTRSFGLRAALALAKLYQSTTRPVLAHATLAPALEGFSSTPEMPEIAEAETLLAALGETDEVKAAIAQRQRRFDLQTSYSQALLWAKGFASEETMAAFARAGEFAGPAENAAARFGTYDAQCLRSFMRGEYRQAREIAETFVREAEAGGRGAEAGAARRMLGLICLYQGDLKAAKAALERASSDFVPERNKEAQFWGPAGDVTASAFLALTEWHLGEVERARQHIQQAIRRADELGDVTTIATALFFRTILESRRDDVCATRFAADALLKLSEEYGMKTYSDEGRVYANWARGRVLDPGVGANAAMQALTAYLAPGNKADAPSLHGSLAELEAMTGEPAAALARIDRGLAIAEETGEHFTDAYLHRLRGEILLKRDPTDPSPAEDAYRTAIAIAKKQAARGYELLASLALAKLYQSTGRPAEAHAVLAPAIEGFSPTPEMPEIAEAQALLMAIEASAHVRQEKALL
jgi:predicted ATPase